MTTPGASAPDGAYVLGGRYGQDVTEESAKAAMRGDVLSGFEAAQPNLLDLIVTQAIEWIDSMIAELLYLLDNLDFLGLFDFGSLGDYFAGVDDTATTAASDAAAAQAAANAAAAEAAAAAASAASQGIVVRQVQTEVATLAGNVPIGQAWDSMVPGQQTSFPQAMLTTSTKKWSKFSFDGASAATVGGDAVYFQHEPVYTPAINSVEAAYILSRYDGGRAVISFIVDAVTTPCSIYAGLMVMRSSGDVEVLWVSADQTPLITTARAELAVTAPTDLPVAAGEWMIPFVHQRGTGNPRPLLGLEGANIPRNAALFPPQQKMSFTSSSTLTAGTVVAKASQVFTSKTLPWLAVGLRLLTGDPVPRSAFDDFNRPGNFLGASWATVSAVAPKLYNNRFSPMVFGVPDDVPINGEGRALYAQPMAYSENRISAAAIGTIHASQAQRIVYWSNASGTTWCDLTIIAGTATLRTVSGGTPTTLSSSPVTTASGDVWQIEIGKNASDQWVHVASRQAGGAGVFTPLVSYTDTTGSIPAGETYRYPGLVVSGNGSAGSGEWDWFQAADTVQEA